MRGALSPSLSDVCVWRFPRWNTSTSSVCSNRKRPGGPPGGSGGSEEDQASSLQEANARRAAAPMTRRAFQRLRIPIATMESIQDASAATTPAQRNRTSARPSPALRRARPPSVHSCSNRRARGAPPPGGATSAPPTRCSPGKASRPPRIRVPDAHIVHDLSRRDAAAPPSPRRRRSAAVVLPDPALAAVVREQPDDARQHQAPDERIAVIPVELGHVVRRALVVEVHPVDARDRGDRQEDGRDDREHLHDLVHPVRYPGEVEIHEARAQLAVGLDHVHQLHRVVVRVAQVEPRVLREDRVVLAEQRVHEVALRPDGAPQREQVPLQVVDRLRHRALRVDDLDLQVLDVLAEPLEHREEAVDHRVEQRVGQVVGAPHPRRAPAGADALPHGLHHVPVGLFLDRQDERLADQDRELLGAQRAALGDLRHPGDDEDVLAAVDVRLRPLGHVDHVLQRERVDLEDLAQPLEGGLVPEPSDIDPRDGGAVVREVRDALVEGLDLLLGDHLGVVVDDEDLRPPRVFDDERPGRRRRRRLVHEPIAPRPLRPVEVGPLLGPGGAQRRVAAALRVGG
ncbi:uncharacterized protein SOCE836_082970 [Sorangium cellulosum]|uniref:Uncharacterized protein n=1 Tax=Sorangium cellulosum TaxID=56 RepID=A0A4P2R0Q0_SORCE|nr:uncharacterized protein SOCE836_082970 [Sorangium cellulosum]